MHHSRTNPPSRQVPARPARLSDLAATCLDHCPDPDTIEAIGQLFIEAANEMRAIGAKAVGHA